MGPQWDIHNLSFAYRGQGTLFHQLSFSLASGTFAGIAGPNGVGKTTLIHLLSGALKPDAGMVMLEGQSVHCMSPSSLARRLALVRQHTEMPFGFTVQETVLMARTAHLDWRGFETQIDRDRVQEALCLTETDGLAHRPINSLSGGECQRVFIARALAQDTDVLILDEPTNYLDLKHQVAVHDLLKKIQMDQGK
ncbi:MAG: ABC transporter ATP-binding protein, partial [Planctomycetes bacterium]|nr:ABC transporter ATP-binding protein [Planctomycetota bacterium]